jgi:hypothetical protein
MELTNYLTDGQAAEYLGLTVSYLRRQIYAKAGPAHVRPSPRMSLFTANDLDVWKASWLRVPSKATKAASAKV